ncbi:DNA replication and repair protein RecF [Hasllibacter halocynthiae]|uniref:DNA replication and repair protein RecF n=1 Tax=Hasllibacter halocynthiae TaxID=595589 RepID=A0A2T0X2P9_9RHOB|nr:DNA replication/repair protein RecF [Hasllibacter halocynthiae]PRY93232.1 DNA replication and repair protein RecF [Hasllibacter halocynthiae]
MALAIETLTLSHFRSHRAAELSVGPGPVAIHGPNGSGKTNVLEAVSLLSPGRGLRRAGPGEIARRPEGVGWRVGAVVGRHGDRHAIDTRAEPGATRTVRVDDKAVPQVALGRIARIVWLVPAMDRLWTEGAEGRRRFLDRIALSFEPTHAEAALAYEKAMRERNRLLKDGADDPAWYAALERQMARSGAAVQDNRLHAVRRLTEAQAGAVTAFPAAGLSLTGDDPPGEEALAAAFRNGRRTDMYAGRTLAGPHRADLAALWAEKGVEARLASTGEQKALLLSLVLANARALAEDLGTPPILLLDEVAAHLDAGRRAALYAEIEALGAQAWMTGTGAELFEALREGATRVAASEDGGASLLRAA